MKVGRGSSHGNWHLPGTGAYCGAQCQTNVVLREFCERDQPSCSFCLRLVRKMGSMEIIHAGKFTLGEQIIASGSFPTPDDVLRMGKGGVEPKIKELKEKIIVALVQDFPSSIGVVVVLSDEELSLFNHYLSFHCRKAGWKTVVNGGMAGAPLKLHFSREVK